MRLGIWRLCRPLFLLIIALLVPLASSGLAKADIAAPSPWLVSALPSLDKISDLSPFEVANMVKSINADCQQREVTTRPERKVPLQSKISQTGCVTDTAYGAVFNSTYVQRPGSTVYGNVVGNGGGTANLIPIPYSSTGLVMSGGTFSGNYLWFIKNLDTTLSSSAIFTGEVTHTLPSPYTSGLHDASGRMLATQADTIGFSSNGNWMVLDLPGIGTARVNTETYEVLPFGDAVNYNIGLGVGMRTAISPDGRFATVASKNFEIFKLYDLSTCGPVPSLITTKVNCASRDLLPFIKSKIPGFSSIFRMRFRSDYTLDMYINNLQNNVLATSHHVMLAAGQSATNFDYLALGDSFAAGEGAYQYKASTDTPTNKCHLSQRSYPYLISSTLNYGQHESVACSGAKIEDITNTSDDYMQQHSQAKNKSDSQYNEEIMGSFLPGYRAQKLFGERYQPNIITLSTAGNDIGFSDKIKRCLDTDTCYSSYEDRLEIVNEINAQFYRLTDMYSQVKAGTDPRAKLYVIGYPQIAQIDGNCALNVHLNNDEIIFSHQLISYLNSVVKTAAANAGALYVDVEDAFAGHKLCETDSWNTAVNGLTSGNDIANLPLVHGPVGNESFHPNAFGQELFKTKILEQTNNFTAIMPAPDPNAVIQPILAALPILQAPKSNRAVKIIKNVTGTDEGVLHYSKTWVQNYSPVSPFIKAGSTVQAWLNSDPAFLGTFTVDASGSLNISATVPNSVPSGFHTLHIYGKNTSDEDVDLYQTVYVAASDDAQACPVALSGIDSDKDTLDDACDPVIDQPPPAVIIPDPIPTPPSDPPAEPPVEGPPAEPPVNTPPQQPPIILPPYLGPVLPPPVQTPPASPPPPPVEAPPTPPAPEPTLPPAPVLITPSPDPAVPANDPQPGAGSGSTETSESKSSGNPLQTAAPSTEIASAAQANNTPASEESTAPTLALSPGLLIAPPQVAGITSLSPNNPSSTVPTLAAATPSPRTKFVIIIPAALFALLVLALIIRRLLSQN